jgi:cytidylate kinase
VWIDADEQERARRVAAREGIEHEVALAADRAREASERRRYRAYYGIDFDDRSIYDLVIDSTGRAPDELAKSIVTAATK